MSMIVLTDKFIPQLIKPVRNCAFHLEKNITLEVEIPSALTIYADKEHFKLIIRNLVGNALKFTRTGGWVRIDAETDSNSSESIICIRDNGIGIAPKDMENLFKDGDTSNRVLLLRMYQT